MAMRTAIGFLVLAALSPAWAQAGSPSRGSDEEKAAFEARRLGADQPGQPSAGKLPSAPADGEARATLSPGERPSLRFLKKPGAMKALGKESAPKLPNHQNKLENPLIRPPSDFEVEYELKQDADVSVTILDLAGVPMREFSIKSGDPGGRKGKNRLSLWDGRDLMGQEAPVGQYQAVLFIKYPSKHGAPPGSRVISLRKGP
ncbi:MAG: hypothetical protein HY748_17295 [Elusimicrobia bacterium]|nr:hypothetical protein [Elusimicrobiota bacterium]